MGHSQQTWDCLAAPWHFFAVYETSVLDTNIFSPLGNSFLHVYGVSGQCSFPSSSQHCYIFSPLKRHSETSASFLLVYLSSNVNKSWPGVQACCFCWLCWCPFVTSLPGLCLLVPDHLVWCRQAFWSAFWSASKRRNCKGFSVFCRREIQRNKILPVNTPYFLISVAVWQLLSLTPQVA